VPPPAAGAHKGRPYILDRIVQNRLIPDPDYGLLADFTLVARIDESVQPWKEHIR